MDGVRLYDISRDEFLTKRTDIIDKLVSDACHIVSWSERRDFGTAWPEPAIAVRDRVASKDHRSVLMIYNLVRTLWRADVAH